VTVGSWIGGPGVGGRQDGKAGDKGKRIATEHLFSPMQNLIF